jgi:hypothetical protein
LYLFEVVGDPRIFFKFSNFGRVHSNTILGYLLRSNGLKT